MSDTLVRECLRGSWHSARVHRVVPLWVRLELASEPVNILAANCLIQKPRNRALVRLVVLLHERQHSSHALLNRVQRITHVSLVVPLVRFENGLAFLEIQNARHYLGNLLGYV